jgi:two-component system, NarL family, response regulator NreC
MHDRIRVVIADDHTIVRVGVRLLLQSEPDIDVVGEAVDGLEAMALAGRLHPDVMLLDIAMPGLNGLEVTRQIKAEFPEIQILVLTMHRTDEYFFELIKAGASGYVLKSAETNDLIGALRAVAAGEVFLHPTMARRLLKDYLHRLQEPAEPGQPTLSPREKEILALLAEGYSSKEIAERLVVSASTIHSHRTNLMKKLNLSTRFELIQYARQRGLLDNLPA